MRPGVRFGLDLGSVRVGVAKSDGSGFLASPFSVWKAESLLVELRAVIAEYDPVEVYIGLPRDLRGVEAIAAEVIRSQAIELKSSFPNTSFRLIDERMTTAAARKQLQQVGYNSKSDRSLIDAAAATVLLQDALDSERAQGEPRGESL